MGFDLTSENWVPVVVGGQRRELSLRTALTEAHAIDGLAVDNPLEAVAVFRQVLLPAVVHAFGAPRTSGEWVQRFSLGRFDAGAVESYWDEHAARFDLFDPARPFGQVAQLEAMNGESKPVSLLLPQLASGNNVPLFSARTDADPPRLSPGEAARGLLATQCWDTAAIKSGAKGDPQVRAGKTTGNPTGPLGQLGVVIPLGGSLFETVMLSVPVLPQGITTDDRPQWVGDEADQTWKPAAHPRGLLELLTWQSRRIRLIPTSMDGTDDVGVSSVVLCAGDRIAGVPIDVEPHTAWRAAERPKSGEPPWRPERHQAGRSAWRGLATLVATRPSTSEKRSSSVALTRIAGLRSERFLPENFPLRVLLVGVVYGNQQAVVEDVVSDVLPLPTQALLVDEDNTVRETLLTIVDQTEALWRAANHLGDDLRAAAGVEKMPWDKGQRLGEVLVHQFTNPVERILARLQRHPDDAEAAEVVWRNVARRLALQVAEPVLDAMPDTAFLGRPRRQPGGGEPDRKRYDRVASAHARYLAAVTKILGSPAELIEELAVLGAAHQERTPV
jgi:CRISPR system Cascade subunit CasA